MFHSRRLYAVRKTSAVNLYMTQYAVARVTAVAWVNTGNYLIYFLANYLLNFSGSTFNTNVL